MCTGVKPERRIFEGGQRACRKTPSFERGVGLVIRKNDGGGKLILKWDLERSLPAGRRLVCLIDELEKEGLL